MGIDNSADRASRPVPPSVKEAGDRLPRGVAEPAERTYQIADAIREEIARQEEAEKLADAQYRYDHALKHSYAVGVLNRILLGHVLIGSPAAEDGASVAAAQIDLSARLQAEPVAEEPEVRWIGVVPNGLGGPAKVTRLKRVAEIWRDQGRSVTEWVPAACLQAVEAERDYWRTSAEEQQSLRLRRQKEMGDALSATRKALEPFAAIASDSEWNSVPDKGIADLHYWSEAGGEETVGELTFGDFRRARSALSHPQSQSEEQTHGA